MACFPFEEDAEDDHALQKSKAAWRRALSESATCRLAKAPTTAGTRRRSLRHRKAAGPGPKAKRSNSEKPALERQGRKGKSTVWMVELPEWFRSTLNEEAAEVSLQYPMDDCYQDQCGLWESERDGVHDDVQCSRAADDEAFVCAPEQQCEAAGQALEQPAPLRLPVPLPRDCCDSSTQCSPEEMLEPIVPSEVFRKMQLRKIEMGPKAWHDCSYSVSSHFNQFEPAPVVAEMAAELDDAELRNLANRFLGKEVAGVAIQKHRGIPRRVPDRHAEEASLLGVARPVFRRALLASARRLLCGGLDVSPLHGTGLLSLALDHPSNYGKLAHTALNFLGRLILVGALPQAVAAEILAVFADLPLSAAACKMLVMGLFIFSSASSAKHQRRSGCLTQQLSRSLSLPLSSRLPTAIGSRRTFSAPGLYSNCRTIGTTLRPQDDKHPYSCVSVERHEVIPCPIDVGDVPDYWRLAAGGEHSPRELERRAREAEEQVCEDDRGSGGIESTTARSRASSM